MCLWYIYTCIVHMCIVYVYQLYTCLYCICVYRVLVSAKISLAPCTVTHTHGTAALFSNPLRVRVADIDGRLGSGDGEMEEPEGLPGAGEEEKMAGEVAGKWQAERVRRRRRYLF